MSRQDAATHLGKIFAFLACGRPERAQPHAAALIAWLQGLS